VLLSLTAIWAMSGCTHDFDRHVPSAMVDEDASSGDVGPDSDTADSDDVVDTDSAPLFDASADTTSPPGDTATCAEPSSVTFGGRCYFPIAAATFANAQAECASKGAHLVTIASEAEHTTVASMLPGTDRWIGMRRAPSSPPKSAASFNWITGEPKTYSRWAGGEPRGADECVRMRGASDWADAACETLHQGICERN